MTQGQDVPRQVSQSGGSKLRLRSQERAASVLEKTKTIQFTSDDIAFLKGLPSMIMQNGLGQTIAFMVTKNRDKENEKSSGSQSKKNYAVINKILCELIKLDDDPVKALKKVVGISDLADYRRYQHEAIEYAAWMKKFAIAFAKDEKKEKGA
jgi:CRISPR-associated protein Cmr5